MNKSNESGPYDDIINNEHPTSKKHKRMSIYDRAAQFSSFAALSGHGEAIRETARLTDRKIELDDDIKSHINTVLSFIKENIKNKPEVSITYFIKDKHKQGGTYINISGNAVQIDEFKKNIVLSDATEIPIGDIIEISEK